jgi:ADP-ribose pyrophosphatase YjhB (NUDIX family)
MRRPGYGSPHPSLAPWLAGKRPLSVEGARWPGVELDLATYAGEALPPVELIVSVRCVVTVGDQVLLCHGDQGDCYIWPGGRVEPGETWQQTAAREVHEETGWDLDLASLRVVGFLHFHHRSPMPADHPYPHPDFLQLLTHATATGDPVDWADPEGQVLRSHLVAAEALAGQSLTAGERELLRLVLP